MKYKVKQRPEHLEKRTIKTYLWFPKKLQNEWRWLEYVKIEQMYITDMHTGYWGSIAWNNK